MLIMANTTKVFFYLIPCSGCLRDRSHDEAISSNLQFVVSFADIFDAVYFSMILFALSSSYFLVKTRDRFADFNFSVCGGL